MHSLLNTLYLVLLQRPPRCCCTSRCKSCRMWHHAAEGEKQDQQRWPHDCKMIAATCKRPQGCHCSAAGGGENRQSSRKM
eukprot:20515-Heterococcus_DN1.PRE.3